MSKKVGLEPIIYKAVLDSSGGMKLTQLEAELYDVDSDDILKAVKKSNRLSVLEYHWQNKIKYFIYTP
jgi:hypothetical protein